MAFFTREHQQLAFTFMIVLSLGAFSFQSLLGESEDFVPGPGSRAPASYSPGTSTLEMSDTSKFKDDLTMDLSCQSSLSSQKSLTTQEVAGGFIQLSGKACAVEQGQSVEITNVANGFTASVFKIGDSQYQTDLIPVIRGDNSIRVRVPQKNGKYYEYSFKVLGRF